MRQAPLFAYDDCFKAGGCQVPLPGGKIEGGSTFGQYKRMTRYMSSLGAGSQFDSLSAPGDLFWMYNVNEPSASVFMPESMGELIRYQSIGFSISSCVLPSYMVTDQNAFTGGSWPAGNVSV